MSYKLACNIGSGTEGVNDFGNSKRAVRATRFGDTGLIFRFVHGNKKSRPEGRLCNIRQKI
jgi:hypothetical protein